MVGQSAIIDRYHFNGVFRQEVVQSNHVAVPARVRLGSKSDGHESGRRDTHSALSSQVHSKLKTFRSFSRNVPRSVRCGNPSPP